MTRLSVVLIAWIGLSLPAAARVDLAYYLPDEVTYDPGIPTPEAFFGFQIGDWHLRHDLIVSYMHALAQHSKRVAIAEYAQTHQKRPLVVLTITSPENHQNLAAIQTQHQQLADPDLSPALDIDATVASFEAAYGARAEEVPA